MCPDFLQDVNINQRQETARLCSAGVLLGGDGQALWVKAGPWGPIFCFYRTRCNLCYTGDKRAEKLVTRGGIGWKRSIHRKS
ncbi:hypothetical protein D3C76_1380460 [compost metagenome]